MSLKKLIFLLLMIVMSFSIFANPSPIDKKKNINPTVKEYVKKHHPNAEKIQAYKYAGLANDTIYELLFVENGLGRELRIENDGDLICIEYEIPKNDLTPEVKDAIKDYKVNYVYVFESTEEKYFVINCQKDHKVYEITINTDGSDMEIEQLRNKISQIAMTSGLFVTIILVLLLKS